MSGGRPHGHGSGRRGSRAKSGIAAHNHCDTTDDRNSSASFSHRRGQNPRKAHSWKELKCCIPLSPEPSPPLKSRTYTVRRPRPSSAEPRSRSCDPRRLDYVDAARPGTCDEPDTEAKVVSHVAAISRPPRRARGGAPSLPL